VGNWYRVSKRINGRLYDYWQRTYRVGKPCPRSDCRQRSPPHPINRWPPSFERPHLLGFRIVFMQTSFIA
jgi:hypothetical protein